MEFISHNRESGESRASAHVISGQDQGALDHSSEHASSLEKRTQSTEHGRAAQTSDNDPPEIGQAKSSQEKAGETPGEAASKKFFDAIDKEDLETVKILLTGEFDINLKNGDGENPLAMACRLQHFPIAKFLLNHSTKRLEYDSEPYFTPLRHLLDALDSVSENEGIKKDLQDIGELIMRKTGDRNDWKHLVRSSVAWGEVEQVDYLLDINPEGLLEEIEDGWTALQIAAYWGSVEVVTSLLKRVGSQTDLEQYLRTAQDIAEDENETETAEILQAYLTQQARDKDSRVWVWSVGGSTSTDSQTAERHPTSSAKKAQNNVIRTLSHEELKNEEDRLKSEQILWCHFRSNEVEWVEVQYLDQHRESILSGRLILKCQQGIYKRRYHQHDEEKSDWILKNIRRTLKLDSRSRRETSYGHIFEKSSFPPKENSDSKGIDSPRMQMITMVVPLLDVDWLVAEPDRDTGDQEEPQAGSYVRTLDQYLDNELNNEQLAVLNEQQVLTRFYSRGPRDEKKHGSEDVKLALNGIVHGSPQRLVKWRPQLMFPNFQPRKDIENATPDDNLGRDAAIRTAEGSGPREKPAPDKTQANASKRPILIVRELWLCLVDNVLVTSLSESTASKKSGNPTFMESVLKNKERKDAKVLFRDISDNLLERRLRVDLPGKNPIQIQFLQMFNKEILYLSQEVDKCYESFRKSLGKCDSNFGKISASVTEHLMNINDVLGEIAIIKKIHDHQFSVWKCSKEDQRSVLSALNSSLGDMQRVEDDANGSKEDQRGAFNALNSSSGDVQRIEEDAKRVQQKTQSLLDRLVGQASTENAIRTSEQATLFGLFTVVTVVFSPLSVVMSLLALQIQSFTPSTPWKISQVTLGCACSVIGTIILSILLMPFIPQLSKIFSYLTKMIPGLKDRWREESSRTKAK